MSHAGEAEGRLVAVVSGVYCQVQVGIIPYRRPVGFERNGVPEVAWLIGRVLSLLYTHCITRYWVAIPIKGPSFCPLNPGGAALQAAVAAFRAKYSARHRAQAFRRTGDLTYRPPNGRMFNIKSLRSSYPSLLTLRNVL